MTLVMPAGSPPWSLRAAPGGAITVLLPIYVTFLGLPHLAFTAPLVLFYTLAIAFLMVSRLPVFSGKRVGKRVAPELVLPLFVVVVLAFALLIAYPWPMLTIATIAYLASLPFGFMSYRTQQRSNASVPLQYPGLAPTAGATADVAEPPADSEPP